MGGCVPSDNSLLFQGGQGLGVGVGGGVVKGGEGGGIASRAKVATTQKFPKVKHEIVEIVNCFKQSWGYELMLFGSGRNPLPTCIRIQTVVFFQP